jgi:hypothetical protein
MSNADTSGFGKMVPGFDFLQSLAKGAATSMPQMPNLGSWIAPTLDPDELDKRISELKAVQFWLEQNSRALAATIQALEVQKMTLATLKGMNFNVGGNMGDGGGAAATKAEAAPAPQPEPIKEKAKPTKSAASDKAATAAAAMVDPMQLWGALTQQFQQIAATAMKETAAKTPATSAAKPATKQTAAKKTSKPAARKRAAPKG